MSDATDTTPARGRDDNFVPAWLAALVLVLLLAVVGVGGFVLRGIVGGESRAATMEQNEINKWAQAVAQNPENVDARIRLGYAYQQDERYDKALKEYDAALEKAPTDTAALYNKGVVLSELGLDKQSEAVLWKVLELRPDHTLAAIKLGRYYADRGQYRSLIKTVKPVVGQHPEIADLQYLTGLGYEKTGHPDWAVARYRLALKYAPGMADARQGLERLDAAR